MCFKSFTTPPSLASIPKLVKYSLKEYIPKTFDKLIFNEKLINNEINNKVVNIQKNIYLTQVYLECSKKISYQLLYLIIKKFFFKETIQSINKQSYKNYEVIIIYDDIDKSELIDVKKILKNFKFKKKLLINE